MPSCDKVCSTGCSTKWGSNSREIWHVQKKFLGHLVSPLNQWNVYDSKLKIGGEGSFWKSRSEALNLSKFIHSSNSKFTLILEEKTIQRFIFQRVLLGTVHLCFINRRLHPLSVVFLNCHVLQFSVLVSLEK